MPKYTLLILPNLGIIIRISPPWTIAANNPMKPSEYPTNFSVQPNFSIVKKVQVLWVECWAILNNTIHTNNPVISGYFLSDNNVLN